MNQVRLPALSGRSPLGVLAALGVLRLLTEFTKDPPRLSWAQDDLVAVLHSRRRDLDAVVADLVVVVDSIMDGATLPGLPAGFPPEGAAPDRLRVPQAELQTSAHRLLASMDPGQRAEALLWLSSLLTDLAADSQQGRVTISQFTAPSGKQSMWTMLGKPLELVRREPAYLHEALYGWRRVSGVTGEYLDHRAMWDAAESGEGASGSMRGVPGATWLALMSYPLFRTTGRGKRPMSSGWHTVRDGRRRTDQLRLPVWEQPLGPAGVVVLVEHPLLSPRKAVGVDSPRSAARRAQEHAEQLNALGVVHICRARRRQPPGSKSAGVLTTLP